MIQEHAFNTRWWGKKVGVVTDDAFFALSKRDQRALLGDYHWVEYGAQLERADLAAISAAGFFQIDTQIHFLINLKKVKATDSTFSLNCIFADKSPFTISRDETAQFLHERFYHIPGSSQDRVNDRYSRWANELATKHPEYCLRVESHGEVQGWFLSSPNQPSGLNLTLAMNHKNTRISGALLYQAAFLALAGRNHRIGHASFSVTNTSVMNIYANLGANFQAPSGNWLYIKPIEE